MALRRGLLRKEKITWTFYLGSLLRGQISSQIKWETHLKVGDIVEAQVVVGDDGRVGLAALPGHQDWASKSINDLLEIPGFLLQPDQQEETTN